MAGTDGTVEGTARRGSPRRGALAGLAGSAAATAGAALVHTFVPSVPFPPLAIAQTLVRAAPGGFATTFIDLLGHWALRLAVVGAVAVFLASGVVLGLALAALAGAVRGGPYAAGVLAFTPLWAATVALAPTYPQSVETPMLALATVPVFVVAGMVAARVFVRLTEAEAPPPPSDRQDRAPQVSSVVSRRVVIRSLWWGAVASLVGVADLGRVFRPRPNPGRLRLRLSNVTPVAVPSSSPEDLSFDRIAGLTPEITTNDRFYVVDEEIIDPDIDPTTWRLTIGGLVDRPLRFAYDELTRLPAVERFQTLECISNKVGGDLISTAKWAGIPLPLLLERAGVSAKAVEVVFRASGGYSDSLSIEQAMDESTLIAIGMNDHVLPREHGFPARLLSVGTYGMKNPKWLVRIDVVDTPYTGFWERRGWSKQAIVKTGSRIDVPSSGSEVSGQVTLAGLAFAGDRGISKVEVSTDAGSTWGPTQLKRPLSPETWRLWKYRWEVPGTKGRSAIRVRAYDGEGTPQPATPAQPHPDGASGYDGITIVREAGSG